jgi:predicted alpha/beta-hydrolase family hydrolase
MAASPQNLDFEVHLEGKNHIKCITNSPPKTSKDTPPALIFTHGAGGTLDSDAILNFRTGFGCVSPITCFQGNMNLASRVKMFDAVILEQSRSKPVTALGGRSMGARAAVVAAKGREEVKYLMMVSYPLHTGKGDVRDEILLEIEEGVKVLFVVGNRDTMCDLETLEEVRGKMRAESWRVVVEGADHGMSVKPKASTEAVGELVGKVVAEWLRDCDQGRDEGKEREGRIWWGEDETQKENWSGWEGEPSYTKLNPKDQTTNKDAIAKSAIKPKKGKGSKEATVQKQDVVEDEKSKKKASKRTKRSRDVPAGLEEPKKSTRKRQKT